MSNDADEPMMASTLRVKSACRRNPRAVGRRVSRSVKPRPVGQAELHQATMTARERQYLKIKRSQEAIEDRVARRMREIKNARYEEDGTDE